MFFYTFLPKLLNMSLTASVAIALVILLRLFLKKSPKVISYALWSVVLFRLLCPVSVSSDFSLYQLFDAPTAESGTVTSIIEYVPSDIVHTEYPAVTLPLPGVSDTINENLPQGEEQLRADPLEGPLFIATYLWMAGAAVMVGGSMVSFAKLRRKLLVVVPLRDNIFIADDIKSPYVVGLLRPKIYLPCNLDAKEQTYIILHEQHHIKRFDHIIKALAFLALTVHWFNPLVWAAFILAGKDMEMSCDEAVIRQLGSDVRADYSASLLTLATGRRIIAGTPLAFGEGDTKGRILNLSRWKKPAAWVVALAAAACIILAVGLLTNPKKLTIYDIFDQNGYSVIRQEQVDITLHVEKSKLPDSIYTAEGHTFQPKEVLAYSTDTSSIYLYKAVLSNESDKLLYLIFDCAYDLPEAGSFISPYRYAEGSDHTQSTLTLRSKDLRDGSTTYPDALDIRGHGPGAQFAFYVSKDACMAAEGTLLIDVACTRTEYAKGGYGYDFQQASDSANSSVVKWFDYLDDPSAMQDGLTMQLPEYPGVVFEFTQNAIVASTPSAAYDSAAPKTVTLFTGTPIWNAYFADLTGDGLPELCSTLSLGSGDMHSVILVYDHANSKGYDMEARGTYDFFLRFNEEDGQLYAEQRIHPGGEAVASGQLIFQDNCIRILEDGSDPVTAVPHETSSNEQLPKTISPNMLSQHVYRTLAEEWNAFASLSREQQLISSHLPGSCQKDFDDWKQCEQFIGLSIPNPLEQSSIPEKGTYVGMPPGFRDAPHIQVNWYGTQDGHVEWLSVQSGYRHGELRIVVDAKLYGDPPEGKSKDSGWAAELERLAYLENAESGLPLITDDCSEMYAARTAYLAKGYVLYSVRVIGEQTMQAEVREALDQLLPYFQAI